MVKSLLIRKVKVATAANFTARRKIHYVVLVDHRRDHEQRELVHGGRGRLVLDELEDVGAGYHRPRRHRRDPCRP